MNGYAKGLANLQQPALEERFFYKIKIAVNLSY
jgi:hypothetical protein